MCWPHGNLPRCFPAAWEVAAMFFDRMERCRDVLVAWKAAMIIWSHGKPMQCFDHMGQCRDVLAAWEVAAIFSWLCLPHDQYSSLQPISRYIARGVA